MPNRICLIQTSVETADQARLLADGLLDARLAACVQITASGESHYHWRGGREQSTEYYISIKTRPQLQAAVVGWLEANHPYELPEIVCLDAEASPAYAAWVRDETEPMQA